MYEIQGCLALGTSLYKKGYDHVFYVKLASASVFSSLISKRPVGTMAEEWKILAS